MARALEAESGVRVRAAVLAADRGPRLRRDRRTVTSPTAGARPGAAPERRGRRRASPSRIGGSDPRCRRLVGGARRGLAGAGRRETLALVRAHYVAGRGDRRRLRRPARGAFADEGLLVLDPRDARVARRGARLRAAPRAAPARSRPRLRARGAALAAAGFDEQVPCAATAPCSSSTARARRRAALPAERRDGDAGASGRSVTDETVDDAAIADALAARAAALLDLGAAAPDRAGHAAADGRVRGRAGRSSATSRSSGPSTTHFGVRRRSSFPRARFRCRRRADAPPARAAGPHGGRRSTRPRVELLDAPAAYARRGRHPARRAAGAASRTRSRPAVDAIARERRGRRSRARARRGPHARHRRARARAARRPLRAGRGATRRRRAIAPRSLAPRSRPDGTPQERVYALAVARRPPRPAALKALVFDRLARDAAFPTALLELAAVSPDVSIGVACFSTFGGSGVVAAEIGVELAARGHARARLQRRRRRAACDRRAAAPAPSTASRCPPTRCSSTPRTRWRWRRRSSRCRGAQRLDLVHVHYAIPHAASA